MFWLRRLCFLVVAGAIAGPGPAFAALEVGSLPVPNVRQPRAAPGESEATQAIRLGIVTATSSKGDRVEIGGVWHAIDAGRTRIFRAGRPVAAEAITKGQTLKFTLAGGQSGRITLGMVYVP